VLSLGLAAVIALAIPVVAASVAVIRHFEPELASLTQDLGGTIAFKYILISEIFTIPSVQRALTVFGMAGAAAAFFAVLVCVGCARVASRFRRATTLDPGARRWLRRMPLWAAGCLLCLYVARASLGTVDWQAFAGSDVIWSGTGE
jgi:hypothetical protein